MTPEKFKQLLKEFAPKQPVTEDESTYTDRKSQAIGMLSDTIKKSKYKNEKVAAQRALGYIKSMSLNDEQWYDVVKLLSVYAEAQRPSVSSARSGW
jgi:hypothetical protein